MATIRQLAQALLLQDESQILYYERRIKDMPLPILKKHGIVERDGDLLRLNVDQLTLPRESRGKKDL
jgi:ATP adenylyltransferase